MQCPACGFVNPTGLNFCGSCGAHLPRTCPTCHFVNQPGFNFCGSCGRPLNGPPRDAVNHGVPARIRPAPGEVTERRQITMMFCDLVGSTELSTRLDPETLSDLIVEYRQICAYAVERYGGQIARYLGDGILVYFGYPASREDNAARAVHAGIEIVANLQQLNSRRRREYEPDIAVRIGIHTGLVVAGEMGSGSVREAMAVVGEAPNIAARLQEFAKPNQLVIGPLTHRLVEGQFACESLGQIEIRGIANPLEAFVVLRRESLGTRGAGTRGTGRFVNREHELRQILECWEKARRGEGQVVLLSGEPGMGKSRLIDAAREIIMRDAPCWIECTCSAYALNSAFSPLIQLITQRLGLDMSAAPELRLRRLEQGLAGVPDLPGTVALFAELLSLPADLPGIAHLNLSPRRKRQRTLQAILSWILSQAGTQPLAFVVEDLHWADASTRDFIDLLVEHAASARALTILTSRPEFSVTWPRHSHVTQLSINPLSAEHIPQLIANTTAGKALPGQIQETIAVRTDGVPLFIEELTKAVLESGLLEDHIDHYTLVGTSLPTDIPATLRDSLMARLDVLSGSKLVAQLGAILGRTFTYQLLRAIAPVEEEELQAHLDELVRAEMILQRGFPPQATYTFKHSMIQETAYDSLLISRRQHFHRRVVQAYREILPRVAETNPELLAHHATAGGQKNEAIDLWLEAGRLAVARSANVEAIAHFNHALQLLMTVPETRERAAREVTIRIDLGATLMAVRGYAAAEVEQVFERTLALCREIGDTPQLFPAVWGIGAFYIVHGPMRIAREMSDQLLRIAEREGDPTHLLEAQRRCGLCLFLQGEMNAARVHFEAALALAHGVHEEHAPPLHGTDPEIGSLANFGWLLWFLGFPDQALARVTEAIGLADALGRPYSQVYALGIAATVHQLRGEAREAARCANRALVLSNEQGFPYWAAWATIVQGWSTAAQGGHEAGIDRIRAGLSAYRATGADQMRPYALTLLADCLIRAGRHDEAMAALRQAGTGDPDQARYPEADTLRLMGELHAARGEIATAAARLREAAATASIQGARSLDLRAALSLARLHVEHSQAETEASRSQVASLLAQFTEGFDTADLKAARDFLLQCGERIESVP